MEVEVEMEMPNGSIYTFSKYRSHRATFSHSGNKQWIAYACGWNSIPNFDEFVLLFTQYKHMKTALGNGSKGRKHRVLTALFKEWTLSIYILQMFLYDAILWPRFHQKEPRSGSKCRAQLHFPMIFLSFFHFNGVCKRALNTVSPLGEFNYNAPWVINFSEQF